MRTALDYWKESLSDAAQECGLALTSHQLTCLAESVKISHENYDMAFYSPPSTDRENDIEREWQKKFEAKVNELERYRFNAETAMKQALRQRSDVKISIGEHGEVFRYDGRTDQIQ